MCQMCDEYEAELRRLGIGMDEKIVVELNHDELDEVERRAREHGHSASEEVRHIVREHIDRDRMRRDPIAWSRRIRAMTPDVPQTDSLVLLREDRDR